MFELYVLTFNCARQLVDPASLAPAFFAALPPAAAVPDFVAVSLQEVAPIAPSFLGGSYLKPYYDRVSTTAHFAADLRSNGSERLEHVATRSVGMTALMVFAKPRAAERIQWMQSAGAGVGFWNMGNKGAVGMRFGVSCPRSDHVLTLTFTAAHLAPMECNVERRNKDWEHLVRNMVFCNGDDAAYSSSEEAPLLQAASERSGDGHGLIAPNDYLFFAGDLNYRTNDQPPGPEAHKSYPQPASPESSSHFSHLLQHDQLNREREAERTLHNLDERPIDFPPTYKYSTSHSRQHDAVNKTSPTELETKWEWAKHRYPSWCDRILFSRPSSPGTKFEPHLYTALPLQPTSDHRPVALSIAVDDTPRSRGDEQRRSRAPFPINPDWRSRRDTARRLEIVVGSLSYLVLTGKGNAILVAMAGVLVGGLWLASWFRQ